MQRQQNLLTFLAPCSELAQKQRSSLHLAVLARGSDLPYRILKKPTEKSPTELAQAASAADKPNT